MAVVARRDQHPRGGKRLDRCADRALERRQVMLDGGTAWQRDVERGAQPPARPHLLDPAGSRILRELVPTHHHHVVAPVEDVLGAVAVMGIEVGDQHPLAACRQRRCTDGHVVEQTEAHRRRGGGVMAWGPDHAEGGVQLGGGRPGRLGRQRLDRAQPRARCGERCWQRRRHQRRVGVDRAASRVGQHADASDVLGTMNQHQLGVGRRSWLDHPQGALKLRIAERRSGGRQAGGTLRVPTTGVVCGEAIAGDDQHRHGMNHRLRRRCLGDGMSILPGSGAVTVAEPALTSRLPWLDPPHSPGAANAFG